ncbi:retention module-containing protein [Shewanella algae]|uniref:retention module-containing protein n=4 Tax=Shewanella algae TaxID=38313 RepID=UPI003AAFE876
MKALITTQDGQVKTLNGKAYVMSNGQQMPLQQGDFVAQGSEVFVDNDAQIELLLSDGSRLVSEAEVPQEALQNADSATDSEIDQLQALIAAGEDPTASLPDTAAGGAQGNEGTSGFVSLARSGAETLAASGYDSAGVEADAITLQDGLSQNTFELTQVAPSTVTLLAPTQVNEGGSITYTTVVDNAPLESDLVLTLSNGATIVIPVGQTSGSVTVDAPSDDVYLDSEVLNVGVTESQGGNYENLDLGNSVDTQVNDTIDTTTVTLTAPAQVNEGGQISYTATVNNAPETDLVLTLSNGASITIAAGQTSGTVTVDAPTDDVYQDGETLTVNVTGAQGGNYEDLDLGNSVDTQVNDTIDTTTVTLTAPAEVNEGGQITYTATVNNAPETDLVLTLSNGASITIAAGQTEGTVTVDAPTDDVYQDGETLTVNVTGAQGGNYEDLNLGNSVDTQVNDTIDTTTVTLTAPAEVNEGGQITYTATVNNAPETDLVLTLSNGASITIAAGQTSGTVTVDAPSDDVFVDAETLTVGIDSAQGGNFENLDTSDTASTLVNDTTDTVFAQISVDKTSVAEGGEITYTVTLVDANGNPATLPSGASVTLALDWSGTASAADVDNLPPSVTITGDSQQSFTVNTINDGVYENSENLSVVISGVTDVDNSLEQLEIGGNNSADTTILDAQDAPVVGIVAEQSSVTEGETAAFTVSIDQVADEDVVVNFTYSGVAEDGSDFTGVASVTIPAGSTSVPLDISTINDGIYEGAEDFTVTIDSVSGADASIGANNSADTTILDAQDAPVVGIVADQSSVTEGETAAFTVSIDQVADEDVVVNFTYSGVAEDGSDFTGVASVTIPAGSTSVPLDISTINDGIYEGAEDFTVTINSVSGADATISPTESSADTTILDAQDAPVVGIVADQSSVTEGETAAFTVSIDQVADEDVVVNFTYSGVAEDGSDFTGVASVTIPAGSTSVPLDISTINDGIYEGAEDFTVTIDSVNGADATISPTESSADTTILDAQDAPVVGIVADQSSVTEGETAAFTVSINQVADEDVVVNFTYSGVAEDGSDFTGVASVTIPAGSTSVPLDISTINDGIYEGAEDFTVTINSVSGADATISPTESSADTTILDAQNPPSIGNITNVAVSEEGLTDGLPDDVGDTDTTDAVIANGTIELQDPDNDELEVTLSGPSGVTSGGVDVTWSWDASTQTLTGSAGSTVVMTISLSAPAGNSSGTWGYEVTLHAPLDHPVANVEDVLNLNFGIDVADGSGATDSSSFQVTVEDDAPYMPDTAPVTATVTDIPDTLLGVFDLTGDTDDTGQLNFDGFTITARGFTSSTDHTLTSANINSSSSGIGVASVGSPYHNIANEVDFREFADGTGVSEEVIIDLDPNTLAFGMKIEFANIFGGELESGVVEFWRDGQLISTQTFSSDAGNGDYAADFNVQDGGFDRVVIKATDNGKAPSHGDNSDFTISSIEFTGTGNAPAIAYASGEVTAQWGADGQGSLALAGVTDTSLVTASGEAVEVTLSGNTLLGQTDSGDLVFKLEFTPGTGHWDFYQYQTMQGTEDGDLDFAVTVTDADGDSYTGNIAVVPVFNYQVTEAGPGDQTVNLGNAEDIVIGDLDGTVVVPGQDYNIAFMVDSSGSINTSTLNTMKSQLAQVFETLKDSAGGEQSGTVKIFLVDFDTHAKGSISVDLNDPNALSTLQNALNDMSSGGGTNYEDVFTTTANWFANGDAQDNSGATNLAFFITDGKPTYYNASAGGNPKIYDTWWWSGNDRSLSQVIGAAYVFGQVYTVNGHVVIDESGNVFSVEDFNNVSRSPVGAMRPDAQGNYDYYALAGTGSSTNSDTTANSEAGFALLSGLGVTVEAIGMGSNIDEDDLQSYDTDGNVQTNIDADELADAILGNEITNMPGSDTLDGGAGNDIIFGDVIRFDGIQGQGYSALKAFIAGELGQSDVTDAEIHNYISEHSNLFDKSSANDKGDIIRGGDGSDILFGQGGNDELYGGNGNDMLFGGNGNDLLVGSNGDDRLTGGQGVDTFSWKAGETGTDHITDFELNKDKLDLSELLLGEEHNSLEQYFEFSVADGNTTISIDADLDGEFDQHIVLDGVDLFATYGSDESDIINGLLGSNGDGPLLVDTQSANPGAFYVSQSSSSGLDQPKPDEVF